MGDKYVKKWSKHVKTVRSDNYPLLNVHVHFAFFQIVLD